ncbi:MAG: metallophosphoesterase [Gammaproteobacteria bacterium]|nr:metallophosphoesterase [Gammaproteobacteria bacterium]
MSIKVLAIGDVHLGRKPSRLPMALHQRAGSLGPQTAWEKTVSLAVNEAVSVVVILGDVLESDSDYFEALPIVQKGIATLAKHGIPVLMICGNHDADTLPTVVQNIPQATLLGQGEQWQSHRIETPEGELTFWGWSFAQRYYSDNPLQTLPTQRDNNLNIGLLHCDRDQSSDYAPVTSQALKDANMDCWLLGHIHQPDSLSPTSPSGYLGTLCGLDIGERGPRGPWLMEIKAGRIIGMTHRPLAPLRWEHIVVDVTGVSQQAEVRQRITTALQAFAEDIRKLKDRPEIIGIRLRYSGACDLTDKDLDVIDSGSDVDLMGLPGLPEVEYFIDRIEFAIEPTLDVTQLAQRQDHPGLLAQYLLQLDQPADDPGRQKLLEQAMTALADDSRHHEWNRIDATPPDSDELAQWLRLSAQRSLRAMLKQQAS